MTYKESLLQPEWNERCNQILYRDKYTCKDCGKRGYHKKTFYHTDSIDEVSEIINEEILGGLNFQNLLDQALDGKISYYTAKGKYSEYTRVFETQDVIWERYENIPAKITKKLGNSFFHEINLFNYLFDNKLSNDITYMLGKEMLVPTIISNKEFESFNFSMYRFPRIWQNESNSPTSADIVSMITFEEELTEGYNLEITDKDISISFKNYGFKLRYSKFPGLNVHHKYYVKGEAPWDYPDDALISLCEKCHQKRHESPIPRYRSFEFMDLIGNYYTCDRCGGSGYLSQYKHIQNGVCFKCLGEGVNIDD